jgi:hypothetical protein
MVNPQSLKLSNAALLKNGEAFASLGDIIFSKKLPRVSDGCGILMWRVISLAHNLDSHSNSEKKTSHNIE